jgi:predicted nucleotidyltransferase
LEEVSTAGARVVNHVAHQEEVEGLLRQFLEGARAALGAQFVGAYLFGSLACGGFDRDSDVDILVVTEDEVSGELFSSLQAMHERVAAFDSHWATQLEVSYIPRRALRRRDPSDATHPHIDRGAGERLQMARHDSDWVVQRHTLRARGVTLAGPAPATLIDSVSPDELRRAMLDLTWWLAEILEEPARISMRGYQSYIVLTMCRVLYTLEHGAVVSKREAARWASDALGEHWTPMIESAWEGRRNPRAKATPEDLSETLDLIRHTLESARRFEASADESEALRG